MFSNLLELIKSMPDEAACRQYLIEQRWDGKPICPHCGCDRSYVIENGKKLKCANKECYRKYSCTVGTIFESSKIPLTKWFTAIYLMASHKKGISSYQLAKDIGIAQKNSWFMIHRIREMMREKCPEKLDNIVEVDETYMGGKMGNMSKSKRKYLRDNDLVGTMKTGVMGLIERSGKLKYVQINQETGMLNMQKVIKYNVDKDAVIITDSHASYEGLNNQFAGHEVVNHSNDEYVRDKVIHTNTVEGAFSLLKRGIYGIYHQVSPKHLLRYCDEFSYRYNTRKITDPQRFTISLQQVEGRLTWKNLVNAAIPSNVTLALPEPETAELGIQRAVVQMKGDVVINQFESINEAARQTGMRKILIWRVLKGERKTSHGFKWKYL